MQTILKRMQEFAGRKVLLEKWSLVQMVSSQLYICRELRCMRKQSHLFRMAEVQGHSVPVLPLSSSFPYVYVYVYILTPALNDSFTR